MMEAVHDQKATFASGCFWCGEAIFSQLEGVKSVRTGYMGGTTTTPMHYELESSGHAEVIEIIFEPSKLSYRELLKIFFAIHDPTSTDRQGNDIGARFRSEIFYHSLEQKEAAQDNIEWLNQANNFGRPLVTKLSKASIFYRADDYHQDYYNRNRNAGYCTYVLFPKVEAMRKKYADKIKA